MLPTVTVALLQVPQHVASIRVVFVPWQSDKVPVIAAGAASTVTVVVVKQPVLVSVYVMVDVPPPVLTPVTMPVVAPTVAMPGLELSQVPVPPLLSVVVVPGHSSGVPDIDVGAGFTVTVLVTLQPVPANA
jgi:hypothetical protein